MRLSETSMSRNVGDWRISGLVTLAGLAGAITTGAYAPNRSDLGVTGIAVLLGVVAFIAGIITVVRMAFGGGPSPP